MSTLIFGDFHGISTVVLIRNPMDFDDGSHKDFMMVFMGFHLDVVGLPSDSTLILQQ